MTTCPNCGADLDEDAEGCAACGQLLVPTTCERHADREANAVCVVCGVALCAECDHPKRRHHLCERHQGVEVLDGWAQLYSTGDEIQADLIRENLAAEGIDARILSQKDHFSFTVDLGDLAQVRILVPAYDYEAAGEVLASHRDAEGEVTFACQECGEPYEPGAAVCESCGAALA